MIKSESSKPIDESLVGVFELEEERKPLLIPQSILSAFWEIGLEHVSLNKT